MLKQILLLLLLVTSLWAQEDVSAFIEKPRFEHVFILDLKDMPWTFDHSHLRVQEAGKTISRLFKK